MDFSFASGQHQLAGRRLGVHAEIENSYCDALTFQRLKDCHQIRNRVTKLVSFAVFQRLLSILFYLVSFWRTLVSAFFLRLLDLLQGSTWLRVDCRFDAAFN